MESPHHTQQTVSWRTLWSFVTSLVSAYNDKGCRQQAAALTYMTLFAIVPTMTVVFTMFSLFPAFDGLSGQLQSFVFRHLLPDSGLEIRTYVQQFTDQARQLTGPGLIMLAATAYLMIKNIEHTFNSIWGVSEARKGLSNFLLYWAILSLGPLMLGIGLAMSTYLLSLRFFSDEGVLQGFMPVLLGYAPWLLTSGAFTLLFAAVPNCRVPVRNALLGGVLTAICFELFKDLFGWIVSKSAFTAVYGAFAIVPLFLLWIYILWMIVLAGAVFVRTLSVFSGPAKGATYTELIAALLVLWRFRQCQRTGLGARDHQLLSVGIPAQQWQRLRRALLRHHIISVTREETYVLSRDLSTFTLRDLADMVGVQSQMPGVSDYLQTFSWFPVVAARLLSIDQHTEAELDITLEEIFCSVAEVYDDEDRGLEELEAELRAYSEPTDDDVEPLIEESLPVVEPEARDDTEEQEPRRPRAV